MRRTHTFEPVNRIMVLTGLVFLMTGIIAVRLFYLQIIMHGHYEARAQKEHYGLSELPARRGEIFLKDYASNETVRVATNTTLDLLFADPTQIDNQKIVADRITPMIFDLKEAREIDQERIRTETLHAKTPEEIDKIKPLTDEELYKKFYDDVLDKISQEKRAQILLSNDLAQEKLDEINKLRLTGIEIMENELIAYPAQITDRSQVAKNLSPYLKIPPTELATILKGLNRYVILKRKIEPEIATKMQKLINEDKNIKRKPEDKNRTFSGLGLKEEYYRYYPEGTLAANILGFVRPNGAGQYGIESKFNTRLQGKKGKIRSQKDSIGRQITVGESEIQPAEDGDNIVLTIDRSIQMTVEKLLAQAVHDFNADNGQVIVMDPKTGKIMAMANYPTFNPNSFSDIYEQEEINLNENAIANLEAIEEEPGSFWLYRNIITRDRIKIFKVQRDDGTVIYKKYKNTFGPEAYQNKAVSQTYEPGSIFKIITMSAAIDDGDVKPSTTLNDSGVLYLDKNKNGKHEGPDGNLYDAKIRNVSTKCTGRVTMIWVIQNSCNTAMSWVAQKIGRNLFYSYMLKFGFNERTDIEFDNEIAGKIAHFDQWTDSELANHSFGQGITVTPLQMLSAYAVVANKGVYMQPHIVESVQQHDGKIITTDPTPIQRVISEEAAETMKAMLVNNVENGDSYGKIRNIITNHYLGAKTGTAQTYRHGEPLSGAGTTIATVIGFAPMANPQFVILAKLDHPRSSEWADATALVLFQKVASYLFDYLSIPPDKK